MRALRWRARGVVSAVSACTTWRSRGVRGGTESGLLPVEASSRRTHVGRGWAGDAQRVGMAARACCNDAGAAAAVDPPARGVGMAPQQLTLAAHARRHQPMLQVCGDAGAGWEGAGLERVVDGCVTSGHACVREQ